MSRKRTNALSREESVLPYKYQLNTDSHLSFGEYSPLLFDSLVVVGSSELQKYWLWTHTLGRLVMYSLMDLFLHIISPLTGPQRYSRSQKSCQTLWISLRTTKLYYPCLGSEGFEASFTTSVLSGTIHTYHLTFSLLITFYIINFLMNLSVWNIRMQIPSTFSRFLPNDVKERNQTERSSFWLKIHIYIYWNGISTRNWNINIEFKYNICSTACYGMLSVTRRWNQEVLHWIGVRIHRTNYQQGKPTAMSGRTWTLD